MPPRLVSADPSLRLAPALTQLDLSRNAIASVDGLEARPYVPPSVLLSGLPLSMIIISLRLALCTRRRSPLPPAGVRRPLGARPGLQRPLRSRAHPRRPPRPRERRLAALQRHRLYRRPGQAHLVEAARPPRERPCRRAEPRCPCDRRLRVFRGPSRAALVAALIRSSKQSPVLGLWDAGAGRGPSVTYCACRFRRVLCPAAAMEEVDRLTSLPCLESLLLADNPVAQLSAFRARVFASFLNPAAGAGSGADGSMVKLDGKKATREEAKAAEDAARKRARDNVRFNMLLDQSLLFPSFSSPPQQPLRHARLALVLTWRFLPPAVSAGRPSRARRSCCAPSGATHPAHSGPVRQRRRRGIHEPEPGRAPSQPRLRRRLFRGAVLVGSIRPGRRRGCHRRRRRRDGQRRRCGVLCR